MTGTRVDLFPFSDCLIRVFSFTQLPFLEDSFPAVLDDLLVLRSGVPFETLNATSPSDICGLPREIFRAILLFAVRNPEAGADPSTIFNNKEEEEEKEQNKFIRSLHNEN